MALPITERYSGTVELTLPSQNRRLDADSADSLLPKFCSASMPHGKLGILLLIGEGWKFSFDGSVDDSV